MLGLLAVLVAPAATGSACTTAADCDDGNACTTDSCDAGACTYATIADCVPCTTAADCDDRNPCTTDTCSANGVCEHVAQEGCIPCATAADCDDRNPCTTDACGAAGSCQISAIPGCQRCDTAADCDDGNPCTTDGCTGGVCGHTDVPGCGPEQCSDGIDNDGDGLVDCADPDCANAPECRPHEICGNCIDDDGDGLVDYEDADCCRQAGALVIERMTLEPAGLKLRGNRLAMKARYATSVPPLFDPVAQDTTLQMSDAHGPLFCQTIARAHWKHPHRRRYRFEDRRGRFAGGLEKGRFKVKRNGSVLFRAHGKHVPLRATDGTDILVTVRVGAQCTRATMSLRTTKKALRFP